MAASVNRKAGGIPKYTPPYHWQDALAACIWYVLFYVVCMTAAVAVGRCVA